MKLTRIHFLTYLGAAMVITALIFLSAAPAVLQYAFPPEQDMTAYAATLEKLYDAMDSTDTPMTLHGIANGVTLSTQAGANESDITLYMIGERYSEVYPLAIAQGDGINRASIMSGEKVMVLDEKLAFLLFGDAGAVGQQVILGGESFRVAGVARHSRRLGETHVYAAWIPMTSTQTVACSVMVASMPGGTSSALHSRFTAAVGQVYGQTGQVYGLKKECMRAWMVLRLLMLVAAIVLLKWWIGRLLSLGRRYMAGYRERLKDTYLRQVLPYLVARLALMAALWAATLAACWVMMNFFTEPMLVFVEWVPEELMSFSAIRSRFWELVNAAAAPAHYITPEMAEITFWAHILHCGVFSGLTGIILTMRRKAV